MTRKPQSIYVDEVVHARVSTMIENATGSRGSLGGFFGFVESIVHEQLSPDAGHPAVRGYVEGASAITGNDAVGRQAVAKQHGLLGEPEYLDYLNSRLTPLDSYVSAWDRAASTLPWVEPAARHAFALFVLTSRRELWHTSSAVPVDAPLGDGLDSWIVADILEELWRAGRGSLLAGPPQRFVGFFPVAWRRGRVDFFPRDRQPRSIPVSFYLDDAEHTFFYRVFGNTFFAAAEAKLDRILMDERHWIDISAESHFLEHGTELLQLERSYYSPHLEEGDHDLDAPFWSTAVRTQLGWAVNRYPSERIAHRLGRAGPQDAEELAAAFMGSYGLAALRPETDSAYRVVRAHLAGARDPSFTDPVEFHLWGLFAEYVKTRLTADELGPERTSVPVLATLAQAWVMPTTRALEAYSGARVVLHSDGGWQLVKGKKPILAMTSADAYHAMWVLWSALPPLVSYQRPEDFYLEATGYDSWLEALADRDADAAAALERQPRFSFATGVEVVRDVLDCVRRGEVGRGEDEFLSAGYAPCTERLRQRVLRTVKEVPDEQR
jgi:hypothetical protein